ncbi:TetR/AcrR family transcriptional regulator [Sphingomonas sp. HITSZ_GF]|uniref:TetR/AcrR family transcriptional regulator n=1 Tax=Sphingomonas sp. HITSZ_GF TaxID=3037247 RepID=UPI00240E876A|nr:TetR/AcrR family transcriptional regulator [Sphingomonas sp. HITSZ_GF]MDG2535988.1 TetR/AcrR family transcriptional regulator [Sphingomonas sp. HITSZ_GF]
MAETAPGKKRRTQAERTAETREALLDAAIRLLYRNGYGGTSTEAISEEAGVTRGALQHHFGTRPQLMAEVIGTVYERERLAYAQIAADTGRGTHLSDWPEMLWEVLSRPSGLAVLEILQASRSDPELAALVAPMQARVEQMSLDSIREQFGSGDDAGLLAGMRLFVWAARGLSIAQVLAPNPEEMRRSIDFLKRLVDGAISAGAIDSHGRAPPG